MARLHRDLAYTYRRFTAVVAQPTGSTAVLGQIESLLVQASTAYRERRYRDALDDYTSARRLIWSQLSPLHSYDERIVGTLDLRKALVSYSTEFLNLLPVEQPTAGVRPRVDPPAVDAPTLGLFSDAVTLKGSHAAADLDVAAELTAIGNTKAAQFYLDRATQLAPDLVEKIQAQRAPQPGPGAVGPIAAPRDGARDEALDGDGVGVIRLPDLPVHAAGRFDTVSRRGGIGRIGQIGRVGGVTDVSAAALLEHSFERVVDVISATPVVDIPPAITAEKRFYAVQVGDEVTRLQWDAGQALDGDQLLDAVYKKRLEIDVLHDVLIRPKRPADVAAGLTHAWYYETTLGLAECHHAIGEFDEAERWYLAAARYDYLNPDTEAPYVWGRLARCYLDHGDVLFRDDDAQAALAVYEKVVTAAGGVPGSPLHTIPGLAPAAAQAAQVIANLATPDAIDADAVSPAIETVVFEVWAQLTKIAGGLDFWGHWAANVPIWTFDYLQQVAGTFCHLAISAERDAISFWEKADAGVLTRTQLAQSVQVAAAEREAANRQVGAARAELDAYAAAEATAALRAANARANAAEYASKSASWTMHQALSTQLSGGEDGDAGQLNRLADRMMAGGYSISGDRGTLAAAESLTAARQQREYEIDVMNRQAAELDAARAQAGAERAAAGARLAATQAGAHAAAVRVAAAQQLLLAFDQQRFTPDVWNAMGETMNALARRYLVMALDVAKRMQRAYNFENDTALRIIRPDYTAQGVNGMLAADSLLADVQTFTYELVTSTAPNPQPVKQTISLASRYPFLFETQFRRTGRMEFQTSLDDVDSVYPGTYAGRIVAVEVDVQGIVPARGISGTLTNSGVSHYRVPNAVWVDGTTGVKHRVQNREALVISDHDPRTDALLLPDDSRRRGVFEGAGVASTWTLDLPPESNDIDYATVSDVLLTITYQARYDADLRDRVVAALAATPAARQRQRPFPLRWLFPDAFFAFYGGGATAPGTLTFALGRTDFGSTEDDPRLVDVAFTVVTTPSARVDGLVLRVTLPGRDAVSVTCDEQGAVDADALADALTAAGQDDAFGASVLGDWTVQVRAEDNPTWVVDGALDVEAIDNVGLILGYSFTPKA